MESSEREEDEKIAQIKCLAEGSFAMGLFQRVDI